MARMSSVPTGADRTRSATAAPSCVLIARPPVRSPAPPCVNRMKASCASGGCARAADRAWSAALGRAVPLRGGAGALAGQEHLAAGVVRPRQAQVVLGHDGPEHLDRAARDGA